MEQAWTPHPPISSRSSAMCCLPVYVVGHVRLVKVQHTFIDMLDGSHDLLTCFPAALSADCAIAVWILCKTGAFMFTFESVNKEDLYNFPFTRR